MIGNGFTLHFIRIKIDSVTQSNRVATQTRASRWFATDEHTPRWTARRWSSVETHVARAARRATDAARARASVREVRLAQRCDRGARGGAPSGVGRGCQELGGCSRGDSNTTRGGQVAIISSHVECDRATSQPSAAARTTLVTVVTALLLEVINSRKKVPLGVWLNSTRPSYTLGYLTYRWSVVHRNTPRALSHEPHLSTAVTTVGLTSVLRAANVPRRSEKPKRSQSAAGEPRYGSHSRRRGCRRSVGARERKVATGDGLARRRRRRHDASVACVRDATLAGASNVFFPCHFFRSRSTSDAHAIIKCGE